MLAVTTITGLILSLVLLFALSWNRGRRLGELKAFQLVDFALITLIVYLVLSRILGLVFFSELNTGVEWTLLPITQPEQEIVFFSGWPWAFLRFSDSQFFLTEITSSFIIADLIHSAIHQQRARHPKANLMLQLAFVIAQLGLLPLLSTAILNKHLDIYFATNWPVFIVGATAVLVILGFLIAKTKVAVYFLSLLQLFVVVAILNYTASTDYSANYQGIIFFYVIIIGLTLIRLLSAVLRSADVQKQEKQTRRAGNTNIRYERGYPTYQ